MKSLNLLFSKKAKLFIGLLLGITLSAIAHPMPNSLVLLKINDQKVKAELQLPLAELQLAVPYDLSLESGLLISTYGEDLKHYILEHFSVQSKTEENSQWEIQIDDMEVVESEENPYRELKVSLTLTPATGFGTRDFIMNYDVIIHQLVTHTTYVKIAEDWDNGLVMDSQEEVGIISMDTRTNQVFPLAINLNKGSFWEGPKSIFLVGMHHIQLGLDHILFLLTLLLVAPLSVSQNKWQGFQGVQYTFLRFLKISFAFTLGHSLTLLIGSFKLISFQTQWVEVLIALSILISSIHCVSPIFAKKETWIASIFGLIHGLAFSISLSEMDLGWEKKLLSIFSFNLGIEAMQLIIMLMFFPILLLSKWEKTYAPIRLVLSLFTIVLSLAWIAERVSGDENMVTSYVSQFFI